MVAAKHFFHAGGVLSWTDWTSASREQQQAWLTAMEQVQAERIFQLVQGFSGPEGLADVLSVVDGGWSLDRLQLIKAVNKVAARRV